MELLKVAATALLSAAALFLTAKVIGHKQIAQLDLFDYITGITIGSIAAELATELEEPLKPLTALLVYGAISYLLSLTTRKCIRSRKYINGAPTILLDSGKLYRENLKKAKLELSEFLMLCREQGYFDLNELQTAIYEYDGTLTVLPRADARPLTPKDVGLTPARAHIASEVIMDGRVLDGNLKRMGKDLTWLEKQLTKQGYTSPRDILLGICDENNNLTLFEAKAEHSKAKASKTAK